MQQRIPKEWRAEVTTGKLTDDMRQLAAEIGIDAVLELMLLFGGTMLYVPKADQIIREIRDRHIIAEFDGGNAKKLAVKYGLAEQTVYTILRETRNAQLPGQLSLFDDAEIPNAR